VVKVPRLPTAPDNNWRTIDHFQRLVAAPVDERKQQARNDLITAFELDIFDYQNISILVALIRKKSNTVEFLERLNLIAHSGAEIVSFYTCIHSTRLQDEGKRELYADSQFKEMLLEVLELHPAKPQETADLVLKRIEVGLRLVSKMTRCYGTCPPYF
jgi:hypothetical protein